ncbi:MAG: ABC transporter permease [Oscillospiraceae bacterium]|jgi:simple sugar transport system permease protein|nr:ABC transporter permease [Oscillospiraceae bacterium]
MGIKITKKARVEQLLANWGAILAIFLAFILFSIFAGKAFMSWDNIVSILRAISITTVIAMGATIGFSMGIFDLSFASLATVGAAFSVTFVAWFGIPIWPALLLTIMACMVVGLINSLIVIKLRVPAFLATLAMQFVLDGFELTYSGGALINPRMDGAGGRAVVAGIPDFFWQLGKAPIIIFIMLGCIIVVEIFQSRTKHGRMLYMVGANAEAAKLSGVKVNRYTVLAFVLTGIFSAIAGGLIASRAGTVQASAGSAFLMPAIAAVNIGQALGGRGKPNALGTFIGAALIGVVENGLFAMAFPYYSINIVKGVILIIALVMSNYTNKNNV